MNCQEKVALITGGAKRVGRAIALELARAGCHLMIHYHRSTKEAQSLAKEIQSMGRQAEIVQGDLEDESHWPMIVKATLDRFSRLDILVNNASLFRLDQADTLDGFDLVAWEKMFRVNLFAPAGLCHHASTALAAEGGGCIINLSDIAATRPWPSHLSYSCSKAALSALTKGLARALAPKVRVLGVAPGIAVFPDDYTPDTRQGLLSRVPLGREGTPEEVAFLVRFLAESGDYLTGQIVPIDGGRSLEP